MSAKINIVHYKSNAPGLNPGAFIVSRDMSFIGTVT